MATGIVYRERYPISFKTTDEGEKIPVIDYDSQVETIYNYNFGLYRYFQKSKIVEMTYGEE